MINAQAYIRTLVTALALMVSSQVFAADGGTWSVSKSSGEVWTSNGGVQLASLKAADNLKPGDTIRTGRNGRVLLTRGEESILIAPNSVIGLPLESKEGFSTTIVQKAGSILLEVEKRNVKHFEVETPYLAAVVKGTHFRVSVGAKSTSVDVLRGQVEVADFKTGQIAQVLPGQKAIAFEHGKSGLFLSGAGTFSPIEQGKPRPLSVDRIPVPKGGLTPPRHAANGHGVGKLTAIDRSAGTPGMPSRRQDGAKVHGLRISSPLGEVKVNFHKVTHGLARNAEGNSAGRNTPAKTVWDQSSSTTANNGSNGNGGGTATAGSSASSVAATVATVTNSAAGNNGNGNGNGNAYGHANGANGNGNAYGHANGANGNGNAYGHANGNGH